jgi:Fic family protein
MHEALKDFEQYLHLEAHPAPGGDPPEDEDPSLAPLLIRLALIHYQFEAIHPFRDGNGRVGRLLVPLLLISHGRLRAPLLYVSAYLERHRTLYYDLLLGVSQRGDWTAWLDFFLRGVAESASETVTQADRLLTLREDWRSRFQKARSSALLHKLIDCLFKSPVLTNQRAQSFLKVSAVSASKNVRKLVDAGIVEERTGRKWGQVFVAMDILDLIDKGAEARPPRKKKAPALSRSGPRPRKPLADKSHRDST